MYELRQETQLVTIRCSWHFFYTTTGKARPGLQTTGNDIAMIHQYSYKILFSTFQHLYKLVQAKKSESCKSAS